MIEKRQAVLCAFVSLLLVSSLAAQSSNTKFSKSDLVGSWQGRMDEEGPAVEIRIQEDHNQLRGKMTMPMTASNGSQKTREEELLDPQFDGQTLSFQINSASGPQAFVLRLTKQNEADLEPKNSDELPIIMKREA